MKKILNKFFRSYLDLPKDDAKVVCIGGGTGMPTVLSGIKSYTSQITAIVTMADEGGSTGRLRRLMGVPAVGDLRKAIAALSDEEEIMTKLLAYRFVGDRYDERDDSLGGHSFGNLFLTALADICGGFDTGLEEASRILKIKGRVLPSTDTDVHIWAETDNGEKIIGEENIDLGRVKAGKTIAKLHLEPEDAKGYDHAVEALLKADVIIAGPGDLYTSIMPNLLIKDIADAIDHSAAKKYYIVNTTNKPFETPEYKLTDYIRSIETHTGRQLFSTYITNVNQAPAIPAHLDYAYVHNDIAEAEKQGVKIIASDVIDDAYPLQHDSRKLATLLGNLIQS